MFLSPSVEQFRCARASVWSSEIVVCAFGVWYQSVLQDSVHSGPTPSGWRRSLWRRDVSVSSGLPQHPNTKSQNKPNRHRWVCVWVCCSLRRSPLFSVFVSFRRKEILMKANSLCEAVLHTFLSLASEKQKMASSNMPPILVFVLIFSKCQNRKTSSYSSFTTSYTCTFHEIVKRNYRRIYKCNEAVCKLNQW